MRILLPVLLLAGCATTPDPIIVEKPIEVKVPVSAPCMGPRPSEPAPLLHLLTTEEWKQLTTDQRDAYLFAQALKRKIYGDELTAAAAGCD